eukprot:CAMPEP_0117587492 /NCGR_PEP_ID=MMETSP0784-20121206/69333_1 /TAXON_ID=39447 /ORGANISM="" /LENGTH=753 /DNA_ID=CAMNT_0005388761 /DNA_START=16 /DNA_END=2277 /DNA_ORIENTATION=+
MTLASGAALERASCKSRCRRQVWSVFGNGADRLSGTTRWNNVRGRSFASEQNLAASTPRTSYVTPCIWSLLLLRPRRSSAGGRTLHAILRAKGRKRQSPARHGLLASGSGSGVGVDQSGAARASANPAVPEGVADEACATHPDLGVGREPGEDREEPVTVVGIDVWPITARGKAGKLKSTGNDAVDAGSVLAAEAGHLEATDQLQGEMAEYRDLADRAIDEEVDLDRGLREAASFLSAEETEEDGMIRRIRVIEALLSRGRGRVVWRRRQLDPERWELRDRPNPLGEKVGKLAHGLDETVRLDGQLVPLALLPKRVRHDLRAVAELKDFDPAGLPPFISPCVDERLRELSLKNKCLFYSSTSSLTGLLSMCYFCISRHRHVDLSGLTKHFRGRPATFPPSTRLPKVAYLRRTRCGQAWSLASAPGTDEEDMELGAEDHVQDGDVDNVLLHLGRYMEYQLKMSKAEYDRRFLRANRTASATKREAAVDSDDEALAYRYLQMGDILMRSQLDAELDGNIFDVKTRAVAPVRYDIKNYRKKRKYRINKVKGMRKSFELEIYDMMRNAFIKYGFQARIGRMQGIFVAYHNTSEFFGFQYLRLSDMERCVYGSTEAAKLAFDLCTKLLRELLGLLVDDPLLSRTGAIKLMLTCDDPRSSASGAGDVLYLAAAPVHAVDTPNETIGTTRRWRILVSALDADGRPLAPGTPLHDGMRVYLDAEEVMLWPLAQRVLFRAFEPFRRIGRSVARLALSRGRTD